MQKKHVPHEKWETRCELRKMESAQARTGKKCNEGNEGKK